MTACDMLDLILEKALLEYEETLINEEERDHERGRISVNDWCIHDVPVLHEQDQSREWITELKDLIYSY